MSDRRRLWSKRRAIRMKRHLHFKDVPSPHRAALIILEIANVLPRSPSPAE